MLIEAVHTTICDLSRSLPMPVYHCRSKVKVKYAHFIGLIEPDKSY